MDRNRVNKAARIGKVLLVISFVLQLIFLVLSYSNYFSSIAQVDSTFSWLSSFTDTMAYATYITFGSCATQFFLIRLFSIQSSGQSSSKYPYFFFCLAVTIFDNWYLIDALIKRESLNSADTAHLAFDLILTILILIAIMANSRFLGTLCALGAVAMTVYNVRVLGNLNYIVSKPVVTAMVICEVLYGLGLTFCLLGIRKPAEYQDYSS